jgi:predicted Rdx family selenoprotein
VAVRVATEILERWAPIVVGVDLVTGSKGTFRVTADGRLVYDRAAEGRRFPEPGEMVRRLEGDFGPPIAWRKPAESRSH